MTARILIIENDSTDLEVLETQLHAEYFEVISARCGVEGLAIARAQLPDIIVLDVRLAGIDGYEVCRRLKAHRDTAHIPVLVLTSLDTCEARGYAAAAGADDFIVKPVFPPELMARVKSLLRVKMLSEGLRARISRNDTLVAQLMAGEESVERPIYIAAISDSSELLDGVESHLAGFGVVRYFESASAVEAIAVASVDLVILPLRSVNMSIDNLRLAARIRSHPHLRSMPILAVIPDDDKSLLVKAFEVGVCDCVQAPLQQVELTTRVRTLLGRMRRAEHMQTLVDRSLDIAATDALTGLFNRHYLTEHLDGLVGLAYAASQPLSLLMLDIVHFKRINDDHGHCAGDAVLQAVGVFIAENVRCDDVAVRFGGEEFIIIMPDTGIEMACAIANRLREALAALEVDHPKTGCVMNVTASFGVASLPRIGSIDGAALLARADSALYWAKRNGRNCVGVDKIKTAA